MPHVTTMQPDILGSALSVQEYCAAATEVILPSDIPTIENFFTRLVTVISSKHIDEACIYHLDDIIIRCKTFAAHYRQPGLTGYLAITLQGMRFILFNRWRILQGRERRTNAERIIRCLPPSARQLIILVLYRLNALTSLQCSLT